MILLYLLLDESCFQFIYCPYFSNLIIRNKSIVLQVWLHYKLIKCVILIPFLERHNFLFVCLEYNFPFLRSFFFINSCLVHHWIITCLNHTWHSCPSLLRDQKFGLICDGLTSHKHIYWDIFPKEIVIQT